MSFGRPSKRNRFEPKGHVIAAYDAAAQRLLSAVQVLADTFRLKAGFNPNQPRVPAGKPEGGRWTGGGVANSPLRTGWSMQTVEPPEWTGISTSRRSDGSVATETVVNQTGDAVHSEFSVATDGVAWDERHTVRGADGSIATFQNSGLSQLVFDGEGQLVSHAVWTPDGPERQPIVQPAFAPAVAPLVVEGGIATIRLALTLFTWLSTRNTLNRQAVLGFTARDYRSVGPAGLTLGYVGTLDRDEVEAVCPRLEEVQERTNAAAKAVTDSGLVLPPAEYGTAVHSNLKKQIDGLSDPDFRAEISFLKSKEAKYGAKDSIRIDVLENVGDGTVCLYDIKTGRSGLGPARAVEIAAEVFDAFGTPQRIVVTEIRPQQ
jgi:hypothetical protein